MTGKLVGLFLVSAFLLPILGCKPAATPAARRAPVVGARPAAAQGVELKTLDFEGIQQLIASHKGKVVVMDAWSTACPPCIKEFHNLVEVSQEYPAEKVACVSLSFDYDGIGKPEEQSPRVLKFLREQNATFDNVLSSEESDVLYRKFKLAAVPAVFVYDQQGELAKRFDNEEAKTKSEQFSYAQVKELVAELVAKGTDAGATTEPSTN
jgi:thiol-disulfide isomerase/thioredoxin